MFKLKNAILLALLCTMLSSCSDNDNIAPVEAPTQVEELTQEQVTTEETEEVEEVEEIIIDEYEASLIELCDFASDFVIKMFAPKSQEDVDTAVSNALSWSDDVTLYHFLIKMYKTINTEYSVEILNVSYGSAEGSSNGKASIIVAFDKHFDEYMSHPYYAYFELDENNKITDIKAYYSQLI